MSSQRGANSSESAHPGAARTQPTLLSLGVLVAVTYALRFGISRAARGLAPEGDLLKLVVMGENVITTLLPACLFVLVLRLPFRRSLGLYQPPWRRTILAILLGLVLMVAVLAGLPHIIPPSPRLVEATQSIAAYGSLPSFLLAFLTAGVVASVADEFFFRGVLLQGLIPSCGKASAILITAVLTALFHTVEPFKLAHSFIMAAIFATSVVWTRSLYTAIILHTLHNSLALIPQG
jgi:membrane protease YdiL (CAAX protease family)